MQSTTNVQILSPGDLAPYIDSTLLRADATTSEIIKLCEDARKYSFKGVCVNSVHVPLVVRELSGSDVLTVSVVGFPLGAGLSTAKAAEAELAIAAGANEIDMVLAIGALKEGALNVARDDIRTVVTAAGGIPVKVILETGLLSKTEIQIACQLSEEAGASFVKTATGFLGRGATLEDVEIMRQAVSPHVFIKASGGIKSYEAARALVLAGARRLGTSSGVALVTSGTTDGDY